MIPKTWAPEWRGESSVRLEGLSRSRRAKGKEAGPRRRLARPGLGYRGLPRPRKCQQGWSQLSFVLRGRCCSGERGQSRGWAVGSELWMRPQEGRRWPQPRSGCLLRCSCRLGRWSPGRRRSLGWDWLQWESRSREAGSGAVLWALQRCRPAQPQGCSPRTAAPCERWARSARLAARSCLPERCRPLGPREKRQTGPGRLPVLRCRRRQDCRLPPPTRSLRLLQRWRETGGPRCLGR